MKTLITPGQVAAIAFDAQETFSPVEVSEAVILSAEQKFIAPVLGALYEQLLDGQHPDLAGEYIRAPLALYVKWLMLPTLTVQSGTMGVVQMRSDNFSPADPAALSRARQRVKADARALMRCALEHIEQNPTLYPDYVPAESAAIVGNIVL